MASSASEAPRREGEEHQDAPSNLRESNDLTRNEIQTNPSTISPHATPPEAAHSQAVRFSSVNQEIEPEHSLQSIITSTSRSHGEISPEQETDLRNLSKTLQNTHLQRGRMSNFAFEPVSLPASRVPTNETLSRHASREYNKAADSLTAMDTPPLTPAASQTRAGQQAASRTDNAIPRRILPPSMQMTKAHSPQKTPPLTAVDATVAPSTSSSAANSRPASSSGRISTQSTSESQRSETVAKAPKQAPQFVAGPTGDSIPPSREGSPPPGSGAVTPPAAFTRPFTPLGDKDDPYARSKRLPQPRNLDTIDPRFKFEGKDARRRSYIGLGSASSSTVPRSPSVGDLKASEKRASGIFGGKNDHLAHLSDEGKHHGGSMSDLKRFFKIGHHHRREKSSSSARGSVDKSGTRTPPHQLPPSNIPFADDHGLQTKYGTFGKILGSGAGGSVRVMKRSSDGVTFAVKQFRERHSFENAREYAKKVTAEFCIGSTLHHGNIIETLDIVLEKGRWYEVMEYAPYDLFAIVMTGKMSREEIACSFLQIFSGVTYLHSMGLAHRDLKLDNVVVNEHGIMKLIDFGSASVFRYPFENDIVLATGIVGSDPYLAPEVYDQAKYDPQPTDIWSLAIIFVCMSLRRFPWKLPKTTDASFKMFVASPTPSTTPTETVRRRSSHERPKSMFEMTAAEGDSSQKPVPQTEPVAPTVSGESKDGKHRRHHHHSQQTDPSMLSGPSTLSPSHLKEPIKGPWRLLRLLPRESRPIMSQMLEVDPKKRATLEMMLNDPWISATPVCSQVEGGRVIRAAGHQHTLEPGTGSPPPKKYSGGRDGTICAWDLNLDLAQKSPSASNPFASPEDSPPNVPSKTATASTFRSQVQAHTHWVNDIVLTQSNAALVSASSDITVKVWRPHAEDSQLPTTVGVHSDYVKCLASPGRHSDWLASGGLDHKIRVWDLAGGGEKLSIDAGEEEKSAKGSVYALSVRGSIMASGGPESIVRLWDPKSGKRITKFVGHTDNVRDILINEDGDTVMTASSDQTVKVWSVTAGRCMYTLTMHNDSVWSLYSDHPQLSVFYSSDRSGLVAKTDVRGSEDLDEGLSLAIAQEHGGVNKIVVAGDYFWTATSSSSINRWKNVDTNSEVERPESPSQLRNSSMTSRSNVPLPPPSSNKDSGNVETGKNIPFQCVLRISNAAPSPFSKAIDPSIDGRKASEVIMDLDNGVVVPLHSLPEDTIEGQNGLIKHVMLNNRKKVLTLDTAGEVTMWDLLKCVPIQSFGKRHLEDVVPEVNTMESVANWCSVDTRTGQLVVGLEENYCFDAEAYADELDSQELIDFREDQRINLGKWILRYLFANLIDEEIRRDDLHRSSLSTNDLRSKGVERENAPNSIQLPKSQPSSWPQNTDDSASAITPRPSNGNLRPAMTPGLAIGVATPSVSIPNHGVQQSNPLPTTTEEVNNIEKRQSNHSQARSSSERSGDYFSSNPLPSNEINGKIATPGGPQPEAPPQSPSDADKEEKPKESGSLFSKKFRMNFPKKLGRPSVDAKPPVVDEKAEESDKSSEKEDKVVEDNFYGVIQKMRNEYDEHLQSSTTQLSSTGIQPSLPNETPVLKPPPLTAVIIQEDRPDSGGVADLYRGTVSSVGQDADLIEKTAPMWLGDLLLRNQIPLKETVKVSFVLQPYEDILPSIASPDGNSRLNANRMLRAKKILSYVAERIEAQPEEPDPNALKPEDYLELYCQNQLVPHNMTLATLRAHVSKTGGDVMLYYKSNGKRPELEKKSLDGSAIESPTSNGVPITSS